MRVTSALILALLLTLAVVGVLPDASVISLPQPRNQVGVDRGGIPHELAAPQSASIPANQDDDGLASHDGGMATLGGTQLELQVRLADGAIALGELEAQLIPDAGGSFRSTLVEKGVAHFDAVTPGSYGVLVVPPGAVVNAQIVDIEVQGESLTVEVRSGFIELVFSGEVSYLEDRPRPGATLSAWIMHLDSLPSTPEKGPDADPSSWQSWRVEAVFADDKFSAACFLPVDDPTPTLDFYLTVVDSQRLQHNSNWWPSGRSLELGTLDEAAPLNIKSSTLSSSTTFVWPDATLEIDGKGAAARNPLSSETPIFLSATQMKTTPFATTKVTTIPIDSTSRIRFSNVLSPFHSGSKHFPERFPLQREWFMPRLGWGRLGTVYESSVIPLLHDGTSQTVDCGVLQLQRPEPIATGVVVGTHGAPIAHACVTVTIQRPRSHGQRLAPRYCDDQGAFELMRLRRHELPLASLQINIEAVEYEGQTRDSVSLYSDETFVLERGAQLQCRLKRGHLLDGSHLVVTYEGSTDLEKQTVFGDFFTFDNLPAGEGKLSITLPAQLGVPLVVRKVKLKRSETTLLDLIDLSDVVVECDCIATTTAGLVPSDLRWYLRQGSKGDQLLLLHEGAELQALLPRGAMLVVRAEGYKEARIAAAAGPSTVNLERANEVTLRLPFVPAVVEGHYILLELAAPGVVSPPDVNVPLTRGEGLAELPRAGRYEVRACLMNLLGHAVKRSGVLTTLEIDASAPPGTIYSIPLERDFFTD